MHRPEIDKFIGSLTRQGAKKGVFITPSDFSQGELASVRRLNLSVVLVDDQKLAELVIEHNVGVSVKATKTAKLNVSSQNLR